MLSAFACTDRCHGSVRWKITERSILLHRYFSTLVCTRPSQVHGPASWIFHPEHNIQLFYTSYYCLCLNRKMSFGFTDSTDENGDICKDRNSSCKIAGYKFSMKYPTCWPTQLRWSSLHSACESLGAEHTALACVHGRVWRPERSSKNL